MKIFEKDKEILKNYLSGPQRETLHLCPYYFTFVETMNPNQLLSSTLITCFSGRDSPCNRFNKNGIHGQNGIHSWNGIHGNFCWLNALRTASGTHGQNGIHSRNALHSHLNWLISLVPFWAIFRLWKIPYFTHQNHFGFLQLDSMWSGRLFINRLLESCLDNLYS